MTNPNKRKPYGQTSNQVDVEVAEGRWIEEAQNHAGWRFLQKAYVCECSSIETLRYRIV